mmetsp:Transcript_20983/g.65007  ORF Transcript_20983/g.65007 Transcript_20983/m.65007 type:complete len:225 (-) Transcript_20983:912-1586(-)
MHHGALATSRSPHQRHHLARRHVQGHALKHRAVGPHLVRKLHVLKGQRRTHRLRAPVALVGVDVRDAVHQRQDTLRGAARAGEGRHDVLQALEARLKHVPVELVRDEAARCERAVAGEHNVAAIPKHQHHRTQVEVRVQRERARAAHGVAHALLHSLQGFGGVLAKFARLGREGAHRADVAQRVVGHGCRLAQLGEDLAVELLRPLGVPVRHDRDWQHSREREH